MHDLILKAELKLVQWRRNFVEFMCQERGGAGIIEVIIIVVIVVALAVAFREKIGNFVEELWASISGAGSEITKSFDPSPT